MRSWKTPALLATMGLCGLGSLFAQGPHLPSGSEPTPLSSPLNSAGATPTLDVTAPAPLASDEAAPAPIEQAAEEPIVDQQINGNAPVSSGPMPYGSGSVHIESAPVAGPAVMSAPLMDGALPVSQPACGCQGGGSSVVGGLGGAYDNQGYSHGYAPAYSNGYAPGYMYGYTPGYTMGSGSGVNSGVLSPDSNSDGLHTRYPYYNYRAPWYYQGPPSQNVTIVW